MNGAKTPKSDNDAFSRRPRPARPPGPPFPARLPRETSKRVIEVAIPWSKRSSRETDGWDDKIRLDFCFADKHAITLIKMGDL